MQVSIQKAHVDDHQTLSEIAHAAKRRWGYPESWMQRWDAILTITPEYIANNSVYVVRSETATVGFYALTGDGSRLTLDHLWLNPSQIGSGLGRALFEHAIDVARQRGAIEVEIEADPNATGFYERMGAIRVGQTAYEIDGEPRILPLLLYTIPA